MRHHLGTEAEAIVRLAEAGIIRTAQQLIGRPAMAIRRVKVAERIEAQAEWIDLAPGVLLTVRAIWPHPIGVARLHANRSAIRSLDVGRVREAVMGIEPAVEAPV